MTEKLIVGCAEICSLPELGIDDLQIRIDTGAETSSLHVDNLKKIKRNGKPWVLFEIHPDIYNVEQVVSCEAPLSDLRRIKSSNGTSEKRNVIKTMIQLGGKSWPIEITLTDRSNMSYLMLLGRQGMGERLLVNPAKTFMLDSGSSG